jgi:hypothetical protein
MPRTIEIPFNGGQNEGADRAMLESGELRALINGRLTRDGRIEMRPGYTALSMTDPQTGSLTATDLMTYKGRLLISSSLGGSVLTKPSRLSTYVAPSAGVWETIPVGPFPSFSEIRGVWQNPSGAAARQFDLAYANGQLAVVQVDDSNVCTIVRMLTDGTELSRQQISPISSARVVACSNTFVLVTRGTTGSMVARTFDTTATADVFAGTTTLEATVATGTAHWDLSNVAGTTDYLVVYPRPASSNTRLRRYTVAHALVATFDRAWVTGVGDSACLGASTSVAMLAVIDGNDLVLYALNGSLVQTATITRSTTAGQRAPGLSAGTAATSYTLLWNDASNAYAEHGTIATLSADTSDTAPNLRSASKPLSVITGQVGGEVYALGTIGAGGNTGSTFTFNTTALYNAIFPAFVQGTWDYGIAAPLDIHNVADTGGRASIATDGTYYYCLSGYQRGLEIGTTSPGGLRLMRVEREFRRQSVEAGGVLYIAGGAPTSWDGAVMSAASFTDVPAITATSEDGSGSQTALATYRYALTYEYIDATGSISRSAPSESLAVTLTGVNDRVILTCTIPRGGKAGLGISSKIVVWRANPSDSVFYRVAESGDLSTLDTSVRTTINDGIADTVAETREILYIQSQKPTPNVAPQPCKFIARGQDRLIIGGLPDARAVALSQQFFPGEPVEFASPNSIAHTLRLPDEVTAVACPNETFVCFTADAVYAITGAGPQRNGTGEFLPPRLLTADVGCVDWRSVVDTTRGLFFQAADDKLFVLGGQGAEWIGQPVRDTLAASPTIYGSCYCAATHTVVFATAENLLIYDLRRGVWYVDTGVATTKAIAAYDGRVAYINSSGAVFTENSTIGLGAAGQITMSVRTGSLKPFGALGYGDIHKVQLLGTYLGNCTVEGFISYDDGKTWTSMGSTTVSSANAALGNPVSGAALSSGDPIALEWAPARGAVDRFALRFDVAVTADTGAIRMHAMSLTVEGTPGPARLNAGSRN